MGGGSEEERLNRERYDLASRFVAVVPRTERKNSLSASFSRSRLFCRDRVERASLFPGLIEEEVYLRRESGYGVTGAEFRVVVGP